MDDATLETSPVVANCLMNRERRLPGYRRELGVDVLSRLRAKAPAAGAKDAEGPAAGAAPVVGAEGPVSGMEGPVRWLDLCCGAGLALGEAAGLLAGHDVEIVGVDLAGHFGCAPRPPLLRLVTASVPAWAPEGVFDLITCVHGLHYVGDKLGVLAMAGRRLTADGLFVANLDLRAIRLPDGAPAGRRLTAALRAQGVTYDARAKRVSWTGPRDLVLPFRYLGADDRAGPNYTGQPAVDSHYAPL
ncbi:methyltransferase domain-containing protein [Nonomuraea sp. NN258]|uniref:class I SAM-dependent methyltransferase n=1 Tax=Nonomuraea antri TaxID=2730852 RepID=UPI001568353F|nr:methyltransferase domain-containing protein [Nonomuraea antri]NRQ37763.1 methyltransferase domain-containing protein [Nonomuraea antri]